MVCALIIIFFCSWQQKERPNSSATLIIPSKLTSSMWGYSRATATSLIQLWLWTWCKDLGFVVASTVSDPGPCCCDWLHGGGWKASVKPWQSGSGRRYWVSASGAQTCTQSEAGGVTAARPNGAFADCSGPKLVGSAWREHRTESSLPCCCSL